jgi:DNA helicase-2/ATP-dependent DNA helicase PcrA
MVTLNQEQKRIVEDTEGVKLVISGPGTGKTTTVTHFLANLLAIGKARPEEILAVTFTVKAAREMRERVRVLTGEKPDVSTIHSFARRILCTFPPKGFTADFSIIDEKHESRLIRRLLAAAKLDTHPQAVKEFLTLARNTRDNSILENNKLTGLYNAYMQELKRNNAMDFDALLTWAAWTFENNPGAVEFYRDKYHYILVDEFQDTSQIQYALIRPLVADNLLCVGDFDQSIYGFRGADINLILNLEQDYSGLATHFLQENYRCTKTIVSAANALIANNKMRQPKPHLTNRPEGKGIICKPCADPYTEASYIAKEIQAAAQEDGKKWTSFAILYRNNILSVPIARALSNKKIPFQVVGDEDFFDLPEIKNILCFFRLLAQPDDLEAKGDAISVLSNLGVRDSRAKLPSLLEYLVRQGDLVSIYTAILEQTGMMKELERNTSQSGLKALENVKELENILTDMKNIKIEDLLHFTEEARSSDNENAVNLLTIHKAKGLEFDTVFIIGLDDDTLPYYLNQGREDIEEERRMLYVAITRAKNHLYLTYPRQKTVKDVKIRLSSSRFIRELKLEAKSIPPVIVKGNISAAFQGRPDYLAEAEASRKANPQGPWRDSTGNRWGICKRCSKFTRDWGSFDGDTNMCECNDCRYK